MIPDGAVALLLKERAYDAQRQGRIALHCVLDEHRAETIQSLLALVAPDIDVLVLQGWDCLPYDRVSPHPDVTGERMATLSAALQPMRKARLLLVTVGALIQRVPPVAYIGHGVDVAVGQRVSQGAVVEQLARMGFERTDVVRQRGEYAVRGGLLDIFPATVDNPVRLDFFGDEVESITGFDADTQLSYETQQSLHLQDANEVLLDESRIAIFRKKYRETFGVGTDDPLYEAVSEGRRHAGMEHWLPLFYEEPLPTVFDVFQNAQFSADQDVAVATRERLEQVADLYAARLSFSSAQKAPKKDRAGLPVYRPLPPETLYIDQTRFDLTRMDGFTSNAEIKAGYDFAPERTAQGNVLIPALVQHLAKCAKNAARVIVAAYSVGSRDRLQILLQQAGDTNVALVNGAENFSQLKQGRVGLCILPLPRGFETRDLVVISEQDIFGERLTMKKSRSRKADTFLREASSLAPGDLVVHAEHGIGRFTGLQTVEAAGTQHDCLALEYAGGDRLFVPVENIAVLSRYGNDEGTVDLDRLGGVAWQTRKARVKRNLLELAGKLMDIAAARQLQQAPRFTPDADLYQAFCARFPYPETDDQLSSIQEVLGDLEAGRPMDRLVCGDVGFGKTEVALRAAAAVALAGGQVAVVAPTTLLARQHFENFSRRFTGFPVRVVQLSRFVSAKDAKLNKEQIADGRAHIVVGTHALLADRIKFSNLGLLVVDEEQHFGVKQKEKLKDLRRDVHVLTLTATPIPRTLQLSLTGVRDMSLITTPPVDRLAVNTHVMPFDPLIVRDALLREHHRGGQSFVVCPHISDLQDAHELLKTLVPEVRLVQAHGQLPATELEQRMTDFYDRRYEVLLATNIIESGLDVPTANTLVVMRADRFGLAQLYQIRGRVGRSKLRAYAYITWDGTQMLTPQGKRRLEVLSTLEGLGAGFQLASHDLDIRGGGNLLGEQQSGHIREVGIELYQSMLEEAVVAAKSGVRLSDFETQQKEESYVPNITAGVSVVIPESYVADLSVRLSLYRRLADLADAKAVDGFGAELGDRFGTPLPEEVETLLTLTKSRLLCRAAQVSDIDAGPKGILVTFRNNQPKNPAGVMGFIQKHAGTVKFRPDQKLFFPRDLPKPMQRLSALHSIARQLAEL